MTEDEVVALVSGLEGVEVATAGGDTFFLAAGSKVPFATVVTHDEPGVDEVSDLDRPGAFRVNIGVGREALRARFGSGDGSDLDVDRTASDVFFPHPTYASYGFLCVVNPDRTADEVRSLLLAAHARAVG